LSYCKAEEIHLEVNFLINASQRISVNDRTQMWIFSFYPFVIHTKPSCGLKTQVLLYLPQFSSARQLRDDDKIKIETTQYYVQILMSFSYPNTSILLCAAELTFSLVRKLNSFFIQFTLPFWLLSVLIPEVFWMTA